MGSSRSRQDARLAGRLYAVYFLLAVAGAVLKSLELSLVGTAAYFVLSVESPSGCSSAVPVSRDHREETAWVRCSDPARRR